MRLFHIFSFVAVAGLLLLGLSACGKRAAHVDPPPGVEDDTFPRIYPDPATDPKPTR